MHKRYAYYEQSSIGWGLVVYHDQMPGKSVNGTGPERLGPYTVPQEMIDIDGTPNMGLISKAFPNPYAQLLSEPEEEIEEPLPEWASAKATEGTLSLMQQLFTRNSKARGNAVLVETYGNDENFLVVTDANNWIRYTREELLGAYEPGPFILKDFPNPKSKEDWEHVRSQSTL